MKTPPETADLIACPQCDALHRCAVLAPRQTARCTRCGTVLFQPRPGAIAALLALSIAALALLTIALDYPFLGISASGLSAEASVIDAVRAFAISDMAPLSLLIAVLILVLPVLRLLLLIYVILPMLLGRPAFPAARPALRLHGRLRPWSMAEIFMIGVAVAMVKVADMASLSFGPAFWAFAAVVLLLAAKDALTCERTLWRILDRQ